MKIGYIHTTSTRDMLWGLVELGIDVAEYPRRVSVDIIDEEKVEELSVFLRGVSLAVSQVFSIVVAEACHRCGCVYLSWVWDSPQWELYLDEAKYDSNLIYVFDKQEQIRAIENGLKHVFHMPLATNISRTSALQITESDVQKYGGAVTYLANLQRKDSLRNLLQRIGTENAAIKRWLTEHLGRWGRSDSIYTSLPETVKDAIWNNLSEDGCYEKRMPKDYLIQTLLADEVTYRDRILLLNALAEQFEVSFYTRDGGSCKELAEEIRVRPGVKYETEMPKVFYLSRININLTRPTIESGVPLRVFDIMGVGGFVLTNEQEELYELFEVGNEVESFSCVEELTDKVAYYLSHERDRIQVAIKGYERVKNCYTYPIALEKMIENAVGVFGIS